MFIFKGLLEKHKLDSHEFKTDSAYVMINTIRSVPTYDIKIKNGKPSFSLTFVLMRVFKNYQNKLT